MKMKRFLPRPIAMIAAVLSLTGHGIIVASAQTEVDDANSTRLSLAASNLSLTGDGIIVADALTEANPSTGSPTGAPSVSGSPTGTPTSVTTTSLSLAASNPFRMVIRPTIFELDFVALSIVEEAMGTAMLLSTNSSLVKVEININDMKWLSSAGQNNDELVDGTLLALGGQGVPTTVLKFFAVGTFLLKVPAGTTTDPGSLELVKALDSIIEDAFSQEDSETFVQLVRNSGDPLLEGVQDAVAIRTSENPTVPQAPSNDGPDDDGSDGGGGAWDTVSIIFIAISVAIFLALCCLIFQCLQDRGYLANQQMQRRAYEGRNNDTSSTYDSPRNNSNTKDDGFNTNDDGSVPEKAASVAGSMRSISESSRTSVVNNRHIHEEEPSNTSSSLFTTTTTDDPHSFVTNFSFPPSNMDINTHLNSRRGRYSSKVRISIESVHCDSRSLPTPSSLVAIASGGASVQSADEKSECKSTGALSFTGLSTALSSDFGPINWFRKSASKGLSIVNSNDASSNIEEAVEEEEDEQEGPATSKNSGGTTSSSSSCSDESDVFQIGHIKANVMATGSVTNGSDTMSKASSVVTDWMKTIRVVASTESDGSGSEITCKGSSSEQSSTAANSSTEAPTVDEDESEADDIESLEHSMANSQSMTSGFGEDGSIMEF